MEKQITEEEIQKELVLIRQRRQQRDAYYDNKASILIHSLKEEYDSQHRLDKTDKLICTAAGTLAGIIDAVFIVIPHPSRSGVEGGLLDTKVREWFDRHYPEADMSSLAGQAISKVPYDAQDNRHTSIAVEGLSSYFHRLHSLGHDPFLGFVVGVYDILHGTMTTIGSNGMFAHQQMPVYADRMATQLLEVFRKQWLHMKSDVNSPMGLPVPLMSLFETLQFGHIGEEGLSVAEIVRSMYYQGYDFRHFCAMSIPTLLVELVVRIAWAIRSIKAGRSLKQSIPLHTSRERTPKLDTMLCLAHACFCAVNGVKVFITQNPCAINYPEWLRFSALLLKEARWRLIDKETARQEYVTARILDDDFIIE